MLLHDKKENVITCVFACVVRHRYGFMIVKKEERCMSSCSTLNPAPRPCPHTDHSCARSSNREPRCAGRMSIEGAAPLLSSSVNPHLCYTFFTSLQRRGPATHTLVAAKTCRGAPDDRDLRSNSYLIGRAPQLTIYFAGHPSTLQHCRANGVAPRYIYA
eukprot:scaffold29735_cov66-Phaeocystis_antarctica.AAC.1